MPRRRRRPHAYRPSLPPAPTTPTRRPTPTARARSYTELEAGNDTGVRNVLDIASLRDAGVFERCAGVPPPTLAATPPVSVGGILGGIAGLLFSPRA
jgi:hypothetical protein